MHPCSHVCGDLLGQPMVFIGFILTPERLSADIGVGFCRTAFQLHRADIVMFGESGVLQFMDHPGRQARSRSEEHTSEIQSLMRNSYAVFCLKKKKHKHLNSALVLS